MAAAAQRIDAHEEKTHSVSDAVLAGLNADQRRAAEEIDGPRLVVSPAGTGKTAVLAARYRLMLARGVPVQKLLAITFSNRAAQEMRDRVGAVLDGVDDRDVFIDTFHALGKRILASVPQQFGLSPRFRIADETESHQVMREAIARIDRESLEGPFSSDRIKRATELLDQIKNEGLTPSAVAAAGGRFRDRTLPRIDVEIFEEYESAMQADNVVDYNDLILKPLLAFARDPKLAAAWRRQFDAIMIDEYQDTNRTQYMLLQHLAEGKSNVLFLGDDDQLIFAWRGADQSYVRDFEQHWPHGKVLNLRINYRNGPDILDRAKRMIDINQDRRVKDMVAHRSDNSVVEMRTFDDQSGEQDYIARAIKSYVERGVALDQIAVLTRTKLEATTIALSLASQGIDCFYPDNDILTFRQVRALIAWARVAADPNDRLALVTAMGTPSVGLEAVAIDRLNEWARDREVPLVDVARETLSSGRAASDGPLSRFLAKLDQLDGLDRTNPRFFEELATTIGLDQAAQEASPASYEALTQAIAIFGSTFDQLGTLEAVLDAISLSAKSTLEARQGKARVRVDTMHASKGLEFDLVIASGWEEGNFPRRPKSQKDLEEDRRLAYVTFSRARDVFLATVCRRRPNGARQPSRFLSEIGINGDMM